jgi:hypothetical protein
MANVGNDDFDPAEEFSNSLAQFGFSQPAQAAITANGLQTTQDLIGLSDKDIDNIMKIVRASTVPPMIVSYMVQKRLTVMCYWVNRCHCLGEYVGAKEFTSDIADAFSQLMTFESQEEEQTNKNLLVNSNLDQNGEHSRKVPSPSLTLSVAVIIFPLPMSFILRKTLTQI